MWRDARGNEREERCIYLCVVPEERLDASQLLHAERSSMPHSCQSSFCRAVIRASATCSASALSCPTIQSDEGTNESTIGPLTAGAQR